jgi:CPA1 family monovalent cation:H+ antiporter
VTVIMVTLVLQGMTLLPIFGRLHFRPDPAPAAEESHARAEAHRSALEHLADLADEPWATPEQLQRMEADLRHSHHVRGHGGPKADAEIYRRIRLGTVRAKRRALVRLRNEGAISDEVLLDLESELDYEALRLGAGEERDR